MNYLQYTDIIGKIFSTENILKICMGLSIIALVLAIAASILSLVVLIKDDGE